jgi:hypothetical protein
MGRFEDLTGQKFGRLLVLERAEPHVSPDGTKRIRWKCVCSCEDQNVVCVGTARLKNGSTKSCGCLQKEIASKTMKKYNKYDLTNDYGIGWTSNTNKEFYFDLEDYEKIKNYCWMETVTPQGYHMLQTNIPGERIVKTMAQLIVGDWCDHINRNTFDNRKNNLRECVQAENTRNKSIPSHNSSGVIGVSYRKDRDKWRAFIHMNDTYIHLGYFINKDDAIKARLEAEKQYYKEFAPQQHLFEEYGVTSN